MDTAGKNGAAVAQADNADDAWVSVWRAARELGIAYSTVLTRGHRGELELKDFAGRTWVSRASVERAKHA